MRGQWTVPCASLVVPTYARGYMEHDTIRQVQTVYRRDLIAEWVEETRRDGLVFYNRFERQGVVSITLCFFVHFRAETEIHDGRFGMRGIRWLRFWPTVSSALEVRGTWFSCLLIESCGIFILRTSNARLKIIWFATDHTYVYSVQSGFMRISRLPSARNLRNTLLRGYCPCPSVIWSYLCHHRQLVSGNKAEIYSAPLSGLSKY